MPNLFHFDEESFSKDLDNTLKLEDYEEDGSINEEFRVQALEIPEKRKLPINSPLGRSPEQTTRSRRRSSVYRRLSIKPASVSSHTLELAIPFDFNKIKAESIDADNDDEDSETSYKRVLGDFVPIKVLGQGAYGKVHLVQDKISHKLYAQKQLRKPVINIHEDKTDSHTTHVQRTIYERQILSNINHHPNIVKMFYALQDSNKFYLILEYIPGGELFHHLSTNNSLGNVFKEDDVAFYSAQMALGLRHLHKLGIVYRDLKPENCLLDSRGFLVLTDFGLSKDIGDNEHCNSIIGTPEYMAPEILKGQDYDYKVDWWSLGCVIFDMMSGKPPFTGNSHKAIQDKILSKKLVLPFYFSMDAKDLLNKLLNKNPSKRFTVDESWDKFTKHRFFRKIDWKKLEAQDESIIPPVIPVITDPKLAENFSAEFTQLRVSDYNIDQDVNIPINTTNPYDSFKGFSYSASPTFIAKFG